jgi:transcriptional regulator with XRE-family HTH domain
MRTALAPCDEAAAIAANVRRLMARDGLTYVDVVEATGLDERTVRGLMRGTNRPHARTLHRLAQGLGVSGDDLFQPALASARQFDRATNSLVDAVVAAHPPLFAGWSEADFDELYSRFGTGGALNETGVLAAAEAMNAKRTLLQQVGVILESGESDLLKNVVELLYHRVTSS